MIHIEKGCTITSGCKFITHYFDPDTKKYFLGEINVSENVFMGVNTLIVNSVRIGKGVVLGAGSVVTKDIPEGEIWAGNPARFIRMCSE